MQNIYKKVAEGYKV